MRTEERYCSSCGGKTTHVHAGFMPEYFVRDEASDSWENVSMCSECGSLSPLPVEASQVDRAHKRYLRMLVELNIMTQEEINRELE